MKLVSDSDLNRHKVLPTTKIFDAMQWTVIGYDTETDQPYAAYYRAVTAESAASQVSGNIRILGIINGRQTVWSDSARSNDDLGYGEGGGRPEVIALLVAACLNPSPATLNGVWGAAKRIQHAVEEAQDHLRHGRDVECAQLLEQALHRQGVTE